MLSIGALETQVVAETPNVVTYGWFKKIHKMLC